MNFVSKGIVHVMYLLIVLQVFIHIKIRTESLQSKACQDREIKCKLEWNSKHLYNFISAQYCVPLRIIWLRFSKWPRQEWLQNTHAKWALKPDEKYLFFCKYTSSYICALVVGLVEVSPQYDPVIGNQVVHFVFTFSHDLTKVMQSY